jgi:hypothetical protein
MRYSVKMVLSTSSEYGALSKLCPGTVQSHPAALIPATHVSASRRHASRTASDTDERSIVLQPCITSFFEPQAWVNKHNTRRQPPAVVVTVHGHASLFPH